MGIVSVTDIITKCDFLDNPRIAILERELQKAISNAHEICAAKGTDAQECAIAWEIAEEIEAEAVFLGLPKPEKTATEQFRAEQPVAVAVS